MGELHEWYVPMSAHPTAVRPFEVGETRAVEPTEMTSWGRLMPVLVYGRLLAWPNGTYIKGVDARHVTALTWPS